MNNFELIETRKALARAQAYLPLYPVAINTLKQYIGKDVSKRWATAIQKALGDAYIVSYSPDEYGYKRISIWQGNTSPLDYENRFTASVMRPDNWKTCKTEEEAIAYAVDMLEKQQANNIQEIKSLENGIVWGEELHNKLVEIDNLIGATVLQFAAPEMFTYSTIKDVMQGLRHIKVDKYYLEK